MASKGGKRYGTRKYSKFDDGKTVGCSTFKDNELQYIVPKGLLYPLVGAFRALVLIDDGVYSWKKKPRVVWNDLGTQLVTIILEERVDTPDAIAKNSNLWSNLLKEVFIFGYSI